MSSFEYWFSHKTDDYEIKIYMSRDCDPTAVKQANLEPGKLVSFQMQFDRLVRGKTVRSFYKENALIAGEWLRDEIGYGPAKDALIAMNIPKDVLVWKLGEKG
jgi:hypothetical protein